MQTLSLVPNWTGGLGRWDGLKEPGSGPRSVRCNRSVPMGSGGRGCSRGSSCVGNTSKEGWERNRSPSWESPAHMQVEGRGRQWSQKHSSYPSCSFTFLSPSRGASGRLLGGSEGSEPGGPSPGTAFRGEGPPDSLGGPSAAPLSPPSGELRWLQGPDDT